MHPTMTQTGLALLNASWQAALLAAVVAAVCRWTPGKIPPRLQFALWSVVFARLAMPILPASEFSAMRLLDFPCDAPAAAVGEPHDVVIAATELAPIDSSEARSRTVDVLPPETAFVT